MELGLRKEQLAIAEQSFFDYHFSYGSDQSILKENFLKSIDLFKESYNQADLLCKKVSYGEALDLPTLNQCIQELIFTYRFSNRFKNGLSGCAVINPEDIQMSIEPEANIEKGNNYLKKYEAECNLDHYELGK